MSFDIDLLTLKCISALTRLGGADAVVLQSNCVRRTCSRSLHSNCLIRGSNRYSMRYRPTTLTYRPLCQTASTAGQRIHTQRSTDHSCPIRQYGLSSGRSTYPAVWYIKSFQVGTLLCKLLQSKISDRRALRGRHSSQTDIATNCRQTLQSTDI